VDLVRGAGATDAWLASAQARSKARPDDVVVAFYRGVVLQDLKHLRAADEALSEARRLAPDHAAVQERWAWNAALRLDAETALARAAGASFQGVDALRADQAARLDAGRGVVVLLAAILGAALTAAAALYMKRGGTCVPPR
jgi:hypothetical protein